MKLVPAVGLSTLVLLSASWANADSIPDPVIKTGGSSGTGIPLVLAPAGIIIPTFTISSASGTSPGTSPCVLTQGGIMTSSPACFFENDITNAGTGQTIFSLTFDISSINPNTVNCGFLAGSPFASCDVDPLLGGGTQVTFTQGTIPFHSDFKLDFQGFPENSTFWTQASTVPEPGTLALLLGGVGALVVRRRSRIQV